VVPKPRSGDGHGGPAVTMEDVAPPTTRSAPPSGHTLDVAATRAALPDLRADLLERYDAAVPGARAAVLSRLLGALDREPLPGVERRPARVALADGRTVAFPAGAARPFAVAAPGLSARIGDTTLDDPGDLARALWPHSALATEVDNSVANLALARAAATGDTAPDGGLGRLGETELDGGLGRLEQSIVDGHPLHPCCRTRAGMSVADVLAYAPEHRPVIRLHRLRVPPQRWHGTSKPVLYAHPWQAERLRDAYPWLADAGRTGPVRPLMSLRTVAPLDGGDHVKTAVDVQMTSAVRTVSPAAVHNGPRLSALLRELTSDLPLTCLAERGAGAVIVDGEPSRHLAHLRRAAPHAGPGEVVLPLGAPELIARAARADPYGWFAGLAAILWGPLVTVLDRGVALEAHGQNTLVVLRHGRPVRIAYRDLGGVRVSARRLRAAGVEPPTLLGDLPSEDPRVLRTKLAASALATVAAELITVLGRQGADPGRLWAMVAQSIRGAGTGDVAALLGEPLPIKATTAMRLARDPLDDIWATIDNPLAAYP
jgi:siderophore synthetase component